MEVRIRATGETKQGSEFALMLARQGVMLADGRLTPEIIKSYGADPILPSPQPTGLPWQNVMRDGNKQQGADWYENWKLGPEFASNAERDAYIASWTLAQQAALKQSILMSVQQRLDDFAKTANYDSIMSACTYATSTIPRFAQEGQLCVMMRDQTWARLYELLAEIEAGVRPVPSSYEEIEPLLPKLAWPATSSD